MINSGLKGLKSGGYGTTYVLPILPYNLLDTTKESIDSLVVSEIHNVFLVVCSIGLHQAHNIRDADTMLV